MRIKFNKSGRWAKMLAAATLLALPVHAFAQDNVFAPGWVLNSDSSILRFQSVKNEVKVESSTFATYTGSIDETGLATLRIALDSVDTKVDLRNVRMRFLLFETFQFPEAAITMQIAPEILADLSEVRRKIVVLPYTINLHGITSEREVEVAITLMDDDTVVVASSTPISLLTDDFSLGDGVQKLEDAAKVDILPSSTVSFDFTFKRALSTSAFDLAVADMATDAGFETAALEGDGDFSLEACTGRFEIMSRADNIYFATSSSRLEDRSEPFLDTLVDVVSRCPDLSVQIAGHTDADGSAGINQSLSETRANAVLVYLIDAGVDERRIRSIGFGETQPVAPNDTEENKQRNRRIEFTVLAE